ncbi:hypothetical protein HPB52_008733 [Rhipicephalus sanguineus]|uniref:Uncharacterized protein n=1 Tax=Rhipicephalus sanguineus TaxID=34632 RepID=A0A9D4PZ22_RHISA|nr:hypothetical protein HPB52_008733 [Rhipicephalus sanguineus]
MGKPPGGKRIRKTTTKADSTEDWVMCTGCNYWHTLASTPYESVEEAEAAPEFYCQQCETIRVLREEFVQLLKEETERCKLTVANMRAMLEEESKARKAERGRFEELLNEESNRRKNLEEKISAMLIQSGRPKTAAAKTPVGSPQLETKAKAKETAAGSQRGSYVDILLDNVAISKEGPGSEDQQIQSTDSREDMREPEGTKTSTMSREARGNNQMAKRGESKKSGDRTGTHGGRQNIQTKAESERRVFVFGDGNALRMKWATLHTVGWNQKVQFRAETATTLREVAEAVDAELERWGTDEAMVVIHAGCKEVLSGSEPHEEILNDLRAQLQRWKERAPNSRFVIYALPVPWRGTSEILNTCKRWNDGMRSMCQELGPWVELAASNSFREEVPDNLIYSENMAKDIGKRLGRRLCAFLDVRPARSQWREKWRSGYRANSVMETLSQALVQMVEGQRRRRDGRAPRRM